MVSKPYIFIFHSIINTTFVVGSKSFSLRDKASSHKVLYIIMYYLIKFFFYLYYYLFKTL